jgi:hypothetical protein
LSTKKYINPFYMALLLVGIIFAVSACAYGVMTVNMLDGEQVQKIRESKEGLIYWMDRNGFQLLMVELVVLGLATFGAIGTDEFWRKLAKVDAPTTDNSAGDDTSAVPTSDAESAEEPVAQSKSDDKQPS